MAPRTRFDKVHELDGEQHHLILLCQDNKGYENLTALVSQAWTEGFYSKPRVDLDLLAAHSEGLIAYPLPAWQALFQEPVDGGL